MSHLRLGLTVSVQAAMLRRYYLLWLMHPDCVILHTAPASPGARQCLAANLLWGLPA